jgi:hypothetical protein
LRRNPATSFDDVRLDTILVHGLKLLEVFRFIDNNKDKISNQRSLLPTSVRGLYVHHDANLGHLQFIAIYRTDDSRYLKSLSYISDGRLRINNLRLIPFHENEFEYFAKNPTSWSMFTNPGLIFTADFPDGFMFPPTQTGGQTKKSLVGRQIFRKKSSV